MTTIYTYYKNHNTKDLVFSQEFKNSNIKNIPVYWYRFNGEINKQISKPIIDGYLPIKEKKYKRLIKNKFNNPIQE